MVGKAGTTNEGFSAAQPYRMPCISFRTRHGEWCRSLFLTCTITRLEYLPGISLTEADVAVCIQASLTAPRPFPASRLHLRNAENRHHVENHQDRIDFTILDAPRLLLHRCCRLLRRLVWTMQTDRPHIRTIVGTVVPAKQDHIHQDRHGQATRTGKIVWCHSHAYFHDLQERTKDREYTRR